MGDRGSRLVVDGMNVIGSRPDGWWRDRDAAVRRLFAGLRALAAQRGTWVTLVLDGRPIEALEEGRHEGVVVRYASRPGRDAADDRIVGLVGADDAPASLVVVTADRDLRARVEALGASTSGPCDLLRHLDRLGGG
ncbi:MAG: NYN domain-containing protein [Actinomycetota bacterium]|nr:NYN domain-containing protein [Actinomycetota bacterium]